MWVALILALITFFAQKKAGNGNTASAAAKAAAVGLGSYYVTTQTDWGKQTLGALDGKIDAVLSPSSTGTSPDGTTAQTIDGQTVIVPDPKVGSATSAGSFTDGMWKTLQTWGPTGTAAVIGTTALSTSSNKNWLLWLGIGAAALLIIK